MLACIIEVLVRIICVPSWFTGMPDEKAFTQDFIIAVNRLDMVDNELAMSGAVRVVYIHSYSSSTFWHREA
jgi:hypothetical protein